MYHDHDAEMHGGDKLAGAGWARKAYWLSCGQTEGYAVQFPWGSISLDVISSPHQRQASDLTTNPSLVHNMGTGHR